MGAYKRFGNVRATAEHVGMPKSTFARSTTSPRCETKSSLLAIPIVVMVSFGLFGCVRAAPTAVEPSHNISAAERYRRAERLQLLLQEQNRQYQHCEEQGYGKNWCSCVSTRIGIELVESTEAIEACDQRGARYEFGRSDDGSYTMLNPKVQRDREDTLNCRDFENGGEAQRAYLTNGGPERDPHNLDADGDGKACEYQSLRAMPHHGAKQATNPTSSTGSRCHWVRGYTRRNGTRVQGHQRCR